MVNDYDIRVLPNVAADLESVKSYISREKGIDSRTISHIRILKRSIDARHKPVYINLSIRVFVGEEPSDEGYVPIVYPNVSGKKQAIVVGEGPAGLFAALRLIELGLRPIVVERGKDVEARKRDIAAISKQQKVDPESNYCFGEGGAGAFSDGKLYTRSKKRGNITKILSVFRQHGASADILFDAHPHIGTDKLPRVISNMRQTIRKCGGDVFHQTAMKRIITNGNEAIGIEVEGPEGTKEIMGPVVLATGHSARDVYKYLAVSGMDIEAKGIAVGVRLEHPSQLIDQIQYHSKEGRGRYLPAAEYSFVTQIKGRGVYSFCMCPGGFIIPAATSGKQIVVNGMSPSNRGGKWSNSGIVVEVRPEDIPSPDAYEGLETNGRERLRIMIFQEMLEENCWRQGNMRQTAPAQRMADFVEGKLSYDLPRSSYSPGLISSPLHFWLPEPISSRLREGLKEFGTKSKGFLTNEAVAVAVETRTSAPVRILRDPATLMHTSIKGLFPCGEGAGYAGGIVSAGIDGERCADMLAEWVRNKG